MKVFLLGILSGVVAQHSIVTLVMLVLVLAFYWLFKQIVLIIAFD